MTTKEIAANAAPTKTPQTQNEAMQSQYANYIAFLRAFVLGTTPEFPADAPAINYLVLFHIASINKTAGILGYELMLNPNLADPLTVQRGRSTCLQEITLYTRRAEMMKNLIDKFNEEGIDHLLFKGYVVRDYYNPSELRTYGDIDFVIRKEDRARCDQLMLALGYEPHENWEPVYSYIKGTEYYEIHTDVMEIDVSDKADYRTYYSHIWEHAIKVNRGTDGTGANVEAALAGGNDLSTTHTYEFTPEFHFLYLLTHIAKHISVSGAGIRMYLDLALFIRHFGDSLDWNWVKEQLRLLAFEDFANIALYSVERWFGVKSPIELKPLTEEVLQDFTTFTLEAGIFGKYGRDRSTVALKQQNRNEAEVSKVRTLLFHIFPPVSSLEKRYAYLQKAPWLLPVAWAQRIIDNRKEWGRYKDTAKGIMNADEEEVRRLKRMYKEIGL